MTPRVCPRQEVQRPSSELARSQSDSGQQGMTRGTPAHHPLSILSRQHIHVGFDFVPILGKDSEGDLSRTDRGAVGERS